MVSVVAFGSKTVNVYAIGDGMSKRGWHLNALSAPAALHMAFTVNPLLVTQCLRLALIWYSD